MKLYDMDITKNDIIKFKEGKFEGYKYYICGNPINGIPLAYVVLPKNHKLYNKDYMEISDINCHGGLTFSGNRFKEFVIGWDYGHAGDFSPLIRGKEKITTISILDFLYPPTELSKTTGKRWTIEEIENECQAVIRQLKNIQLEWEMYGSK